MSSNEEESVSTTSESDTLSRLLQDKIQEIEIQSFNKADFIKQKRREADSLFRECGDENRLETAFVQMFVDLELSKHELSTIQYEKKNCELERDKVRSERDTLSAKNEKLAELARTLHIEHGLMKEERDRVYAENEKNTRELKEKMEKIFNEVTEKIHAEEAAREETMNENTHLREIASKLQEEVEKHIEYIGKLTEMIRLQESLLKSKDDEFASKTSKFQQEIEMLTQENQKRYEEASEYANKLSYILRTLEEMTSMNKLLQEEKSARMQLMEALKKENEHLIEERKCTGAQVVLLEANKFELLNEMEKAKKTIVQLKNLAKDLAADRDRAHRLLQDRPSEITSSTASPPDESQSNASAD